MVHRGYTCLLQWQPGDFGIIGISVIIAVGVILSPDISCWVCGTLKSLLKKGQLERGSGVRF